MAKGPDWARTGTIVGYAEWLRKKSDALAVVVIRRDDAAMAIHPFVAPRDARDLVRVQVMELAEAVEDARLGKRKDARLVMEAPRE